MRILVLSLVLMHENRLILLSFPNSLMPPCAICKFCFISKRHQTATDKQSKSGHWQDTALLVIILIILFNVHNVLKTWCFEQIVCCEDKPIFWRLTHKKRDVGPSGPHTASLKPYVYNTSLCHGNRSYYINPVWQHSSILYYWMWSAVVSILSRTSSLPDHLLLQVLGVLVPHVLRIKHCFLLENLNK